MEVMVSNHCQYLCPDSSAPVADNGKSPLALLAQTCNSIGLPDGQSKGKSTILPATDKVSSPSVKKEALTNDRGKLDHGGKSPKSAKANDAEGRSSRVELNGNRTENSGAKDEQPESSQSGVDHRSITTNNGQAASELASSNSGGSQAIPPTFTSPARCPPSMLQPHLYPGYPFSQLMSSQAVGMNPFCFSGFPGLSAAAAAAASGVPTFAPPYGNLPFMTNPAFPRLCVDPTCKSCPARTPSMPCSLSCNSCSSHSAMTPDMTAMWLNYATLMHNAGVSPTSTGLPTMPTPVATTHVAALSAAPPTTETATATTPNSSTGGNVCCWVVAGRQMCLKRFATSEDLMNHMKTHANQDQTAVSQSMSVNSVPPPSQPAVTVADVLPPSSVAAPTPVMPSFGPTSNLPGFNPFLTLPTLGAGVSAAGGTPLLGSLATSAGGRITPSNYMNVFRFHPYGPKLSPPSSMSAAAAAAASLSGLSPNGYSALTALYGQRLPGSLPHP